MWFEEKAVALMDSDRARACEGDFELRSGEAGSRKKPILLWEVLHPSRVRSAVLSYRHLQKFFLDYLTLEVDCCNYLTQFNFPLAMT